MKKTLMLCLFYLFSFSSALVAQDIVGFWKTIDDETGKAESIVAVYEYQGKYYGRIVATYDENGNINATMYAPGQRAPGVIGNPFYAGLDIIWNLQNDGSRYTDGKILDPEHGRVYGAELWVNNNGDLVVRGKLLFFGRNQTWPPAQDNDFPSNFRKPDLTAFVPSIPRVK